MTSQRAMGLAGRDGSSGRATSIMFGEKRLHRLHSAQEAAREIWTAQNIGASARERRRTGGDDRTRSGHKPAWQDGHGGTGARMRDAHRPATRKNRWMRESV